MLYLKATRDLILPFLCKCSNILGFGRTKQLTINVLKHLHTNKCWSHYLFYFTWSLQELDQNNLKDVLWLTEIISCFLKRCLCTPFMSPPLLLSTCLSPLFPSLSSSVSLGSRLAVGRGLNKPFCGRSFTSTDLKRFPFFSGMPRRKPQDRVMNVFPVWRIAKQGNNNGGEGG